MKQQVSTPIPQDILAAQDMITALLNAKVSKSQIARKMEMSCASICKILNNEKLFISYRKFQKLLYLYCYALVTNTLVN